MTLGNKTMSSTDADTMELVSTWMQINSEFFNLQSYNGLDLLMEVYLLAKSVQQMN